MSVRNRKLRPLVSGLALAAGVASLTACSTLRGPPRDGYVSQTSGNTLQLCLERGLQTVPGQVLHLVRHEPIGGPKSQVGPRAREVGVARVTASNDDGCFSALVVSGHVRRYDHVRYGEVQ